MKAFPVIISFFTRDTPYEEEVQNLIASCERYGLETLIEGIDPLPSWELACAFKPYFILEKLRKERRPLLWVDADGVFQKKPEWQEAFEGDLAVRYHPEMKKDDPSKVVTSTVFVSATPAAEDLLERWAGRCQREILSPERRGEFWDQTALRDEIDVGGEAKVHPLPLSYAKIFDHPLDRILVPKPVIEHFQASRRLKSLPKFN